MTIKKLTAAIISLMMVFAAAISVPAAEAVSETTADMTASSFSSNTGYLNGRKDEGKIYIGYAIIDGKLDEGNSNWEGSSTDIVLNNEVSGEGFTAVRVTGDSSVSISGRLKLSDESDGQMVSDFTGLGSAVTAAQGAWVYVDDMNYTSEGFGRSFAVLRNSSMVIRNSDITAMGNIPLVNTWDGYYNSASASMMVVSPWVLGILGGIRTINLMGASSSLVVADSALSAGSWAVISTDSCSEPYLWVFGSSLNILPGSAGGMNSGWKILGYEEDAYGSGYGTYLIGEAQEYLYGAAINGATYASILDEGDVYYQELKAGETYPARDVNGTDLGSYDAEHDVDTVIHTVFGFLVRDHGSIHVLEGTTVDTAECIFLYKAGNAVLDVSGADLHPGNGIILQMMDADNKTVGGKDPFGTYLVEAPGFPEAEAAGADETDGSYASGGFAEASGEISAEPADVVPGEIVELNLANGIYDGDIYNATGYYGQAADSLTVTIAEDAELDGDIALTSHVHGIWLNGRSADDVIAAIDEANAYHDEIGGYYADTDPIEYRFLDIDGRGTEEKDQAAAIQFTKFSIMEYYLLGHVLNMIRYNGRSIIDVKAEGTWKVRTASLLTSLEIADGAHVFGEIILLDDGSILLLPSDTEAAPGTYRASQ